MSFFEKSTNAFPYWVGLAGLWALWMPEVFTWFTGPLIPIGLGMIMLGMGLTLSWVDFRGVLKYPGWTGLGVLLQYLVMPLLGWMLGKVYQLPTPYAVGLVLVSCCPGGTASNVVSYLAGARVSLSVTMTAISTLMAVIMTPTLTWVLVGSRVEIQFWGLLIKTFQVVIIPVLLGIGLNHFFPKATSQINKISPFVAVIFITLIVASIVGAGREQLLESGLQLLIAVFSLHALGFLLGYFLALFFFRDKLTARTISIEVGMQNSGLGVVLARGYFLNPATAIPSALSSITHCLIGSFMASLWRKDIPGDSIEKN